MICAFGVEVCGMINALQLLPQRYHEPNVTWPPGLEQKQRVLVVKCEDKHLIVLQSFRQQESAASATEDLNRCILPPDSDIYLLIQHEKRRKRDSRI